MFELQSRRSHKYGTESFENPSEEKQIEMKREKLGSEMPRKKSTHWLNKNLIIRYFMEAKFYSWLETQRF